jgi:hypothetical protein
MPADRLVFVYNADNGFFNALMDSAHKVFSPATYECTLCKFTYGLTGMLLPWKRFIDALDLPVVFLHRNEFREQFPQCTAPLPVVLLESGERGLEDFISADEIAAAGGLDALIALVRERLTGRGHAPGW